MKKILFACLLVMFIASSLAQTHTFESIAFTSGGKISKCAFAPTSLMFNDTSYLAFPGFGTDHTHAAYGDHTHTGCNFWMEQTGSTNNLYSNHTGNIGIGTTNPYDAKLRIATNSSNPGLYITNTMGWGVYSNTTSDAGYFVSNTGRGIYATSSSGYAAIFDQGMVGIGKTNPTALLDVNGSIKGASDAGTAITGTVISNGVGVYGYASGTSGIGVDGYSYLVGTGVRGTSSSGTGGSFSSATGTALKTDAQSGGGYAGIFMGGNVGIKTTAPLAPLDVNGNALINGATVGIGANAGSNGNVVFGINALNAAWGNHYVTAIGSRALFNDYAGNSNTAVGYESMFSSGNNTSANNTGIGNQSLYSLTAGYNNTAIGESSGRYYSSGTSVLAGPNYSTFIGSNTRASANGNTNETVIGYGTIGSGSNTITIGNSSSTDTYLAGIIHAGTGTSGDWNTAYSHVSSTSNPHSTTKAQVGLGSVENTALSTWAGSSNLTTLGAIISCTSFSTSGSIGIGTTSPTGLINSISSAANAINFDMYSSTANVKSNVVMRKGCGTPSSPSRINSGDQIGAFTFTGGYDASGTFSWPGGAQAGLFAKAEENFSSATNLGTCFTMETTAPGGTGSRTEKVRVTGGGNVGFGTTSPTALVDINSDIVRLRTAKTPASATAAGNAGDICWDASYIYICISANTWKRSAITTW